MFTGDIIEIKRSFWRIKEAVHHIDTNMMIYEIDLIHPTQKEFMSPIRIPYSVIEMILSNPDVDYYSKQSKGSYDESADA